MSKCYTESIQCAKCWNPIKRKIWRVFTADENQEFIDLIRNHKFFNCTCKNCWDEFDAWRYPLIYENRKKNFIIKYVRKISFLKFENLTSKEDKILFDKNKYKTIRVVKWYREFIDKIWILEDWFYDTYMETLKLFLIFQLYWEPDKINNIYYLGTQNNVIEFEIVWRWWSALKRIPIDEYNKLLHLYDFRINNWEFTEVSRLNVSNYIKILDREKSKKPLNIKVL